MLSVITRKSMSAETLAFLRCLKAQLKLSMLDFLPRATNVKSHQQRDVQRKARWQTLRSDLEEFCLGICLLMTNRNRKLEEY